MHCSAAHSDCSGSCGALPRPPVQTGALLPPALFIVQFPPQELHWLKGAAAPDPCGGNPVPSLCGDSSAAHAVSTAGATAEVSVVKELKVAPRLLRSITPSQTACQSAPASHTARQSQNPFLREPNLRWLHIFVSSKMTERIN